MPFQIKDASTMRPALLAGVIYSWGEHRDVLKDMGFSNRECDKIQDATSGYQLVWGDSSERINIYNRNIPGDLVRISFLDRATGKPFWPPQGGGTWNPKYITDISEAPPLNRFLSLFNAYGIYSVYLNNALFSWIARGSVPVQLPMLMMWGYVRGFGRGDYSNFDSGYPRFTEEGTLLSDLAYSRHAQNDQYTSIPSDFAWANANGGAGADSICFWLSGHGAGSGVPYFASLAFGRPTPWVEFPESGRFIRESIQNGVEITPFNAATGTIWEIDGNLRPQPPEWVAFTEECKKHHEAIHEFLNEGMPCNWTEWKNFIPTEAQEAEDRQDLIDAENASKSQPTVHISNNPPGSPVHGQLWLNKEQGKLKVYYKDDRTQYWIDAN